LYSLVVIGWLSPGTQDLLKENLNLKKYLNVVTYENQQLKEALKRQKGYLERSPQTLEKERGEEQDKKGDWTNDWQAAIRLETVTDKIHFTPFYRHFSKVGKNGRRTRQRKNQRKGNGKKRVLPFNSGREERDWEPFILIGLGKWRS
jgi:hypothetical protein